MGVFLSLCSGRGYPPGLPHVRGGVSTLAKPACTLVQSSPRAWGCFRQKAAVFSFDSVFPTCVGVFLAKRLFVNSITGLPHVRGGVSGIVLDPFVGTGSSPRAWGCFSGERPDYRTAEVFPTCVGVFPSV